MRNAANRMQPVVCNSRITDKAGLQVVIIIPCIPIYKINGCTCIVLPEKEPADEQC